LPPKPDKPKQKQYKTELALRRAMMKDPAATGKKLPSTPNQSGGSQKRGLEMHGRRGKVLKILRDADEMSARELAEILGISECTALRDFNVLKDAGLAQSRKLPGSRAGLVWKANTWSGSDAI